MDSLDESDFSEEDIDEFLEGKVSTYKDEKVEVSIIGEYDEDEVLASYDNIPLIEDRVKLGLIDGEFWVIKNYSHEDPT